MSTDDEFDLDKVRDLVELANANTVTDTASLKRCIRDHNLVFGIWQDPESPLVHRHRRMIHLIGLQAFGNIRIFLAFVNVPNESVH